MQQQTNTAALCAYGRAYYTTHSVFGIFKDQWANLFLGPDVTFNIERFLSSQTKNQKEKIGFIHSVLSAIPIFRQLLAEIKLAEFAKKHSVIQYVIFGSGFDSFSLRSLNRNIRVFEVDQKFQLAQKSKILRNQRISTATPTKFVPVDFSCEKASDRLLAQGFDPNIPTFFSILGVFYYLRPIDVENTIREINFLSQSDRELIFDYPLEGFHTNPNCSVYKFSEISKDLGEVMNSGFTEEFMESVLSTNGFQILENIGPERAALTFLTDLDTFENVRFVYSKGIR